ncbi:hypothetical protein Desaci_3958 [Desulfosporosinus acidiphilus SJ4]|uniref:Uncharacterized protein n=1 Tax=Desulfosporosinus acidiphilus (strain DSM 22704 / JCM 16185 / SJ4) TaxID=646529 RepID=I4DAK4_DESAJ|nr:hypothetical protein [Desulfosporosinus acidiphilus]AFM42828.1 hypothetical protein Desaci_3958 [Desulfosporosinus acidiphilus SJ4]
MNSNILRSKIESRVFTHKTFSNRVTLTLETPKNINTCIAAEQWLIKEGFHLVPDSSYCYGDEKDMEPLYLYYSYSRNIEETFQKYKILLNINPENMSQEQQNEFGRYIQSIYIFAISETGTIFMM